MKIYLAVTSSGYGEAPEALKAFTRYEDADAYELGDEVQELELNDGPVAARRRFYANWSERDAAPVFHWKMVDPEGLPDLVSDIDEAGVYGHVQGWVEDAVYIESRRSLWARQQGNEGHRTGI